MKNLIILISLFFLLILATFFLFYIHETSNDFVYNVIDNENDDVELIENFDNVIDLNEEFEIDEVIEDLPSTYNIDMSFVAQAPDGNWDLPYQETCEEASLILVSYYFQGKNIDKEIMNDELLKVVEWEKENLGTYSDTDVNEVLQMAKDYFGLNGRLETDISINNIKNELSKGNLIVAPFAGRLLGNEYFSGAGPLYHMLVIKGYDRNEFITHDVGTRHGADYKYKYSTLINAIHNLPQEEGEVYRPYESTDDDLLKETKMIQGDKVIIVFSPTSE